MDTVYEYGITLDIMVKLAVSMALGLIMGLERELKRKPAGLKTSILITLASCLLTVVSIHSAYQLPAAAGTMRDPMRLAAQIVSGVGFLGAGVILRRHHDTISGLTTAAMAWVASAIGITVGAGFMLEAIVAVALLFVGIKLIPAVIWWIGPRSLHQQEIRMELVVDRATELSALMEELHHRNIRIKGTSIEDGAGKEGYKLSIEGTVAEHTQAENLYLSTKSITGILYVKVETY
ncbi:MgtC/SapB family protein [Paenibacillus pinihumi]|uniref:MgtC/SapB family protein n=1 Tax=Paenibacillus pinihumi TaxID=669462 RepID=UPI000405C27E|nr:MgtC/SapB family protein [Paenibacillus pinihumi]